MKRHVLFVGLLLSFCGSVVAQNKTLGVGVSTPNSNAALHVESPTFNQGFIMPRLTTAQRTATGFVSILGAPDDGLMVYDTDEKTVFVWDGAQWKTTTSDAQGGAGKFVVNDVNSTDPGLWVETNSSQPLSAAIYGLNTGTGDVAGSFRIANASSTFSALYGETNGTGAAIFGNQLGTGRGVQAQIQNASNSQAALRSFTNGLGRSGFFTINNPSNSSSGIYTETNGSGHALEAVQTGAGNGIFATSMAGSGLTAISSGPTTSAIEAYKTDGGGNSIQAGHNGSNAHGNGNAIYGFADGGASNAIKGTVVAGNGHAGFFDITSGTSGNAVVASTNGSGNAIYAENSGSGNAIGGLFRNTNNGNTFPAIQAETTGPAPGISIIQNPGSAGSGMYVAIQNTATSSPALNINYQGTGTVARIDQNNASNFSAALESISTGGPSARFNITNVSSGSNVLEVATQGTGRAAIFQNLNGSSAQQVVEITGNGAGNNLISTATGTGFAGYFSINNASSSATAFGAETNGTGRAGLFYSSNASNSSPALQGRSVGIGSGVSGLNTGSGNAGAFDINNSVSSGDALFAATDGTGNSLKLNHTGASGSIAVFQSGSTNVARIGKNGMGYFNGGTQSSGADVAEMFEVEGEVTSYEPGDVLVISESTDRTVEKSSSSNSTKVAGVYATKPGVRLTERNLDENMDDLVPMGVIGVIPTKVCLENGPIKRGDILVTSSKAGHAMKAIPVIVNGVEIYPTGAILGKALENFNGAETGKIKVLVNVK